MVWYLRFGFSGAGVFCVFLVFRDILRQLDFLDDCLFNLVVFYVAHMDVELLDFQIDVLRTVMRNLSQDVKYKAAQGIIIIVFQIDAGFVLISSREILPLISQLDSVCWAM